MPVHKFEWRMWCAMALLSLAMPLSSFAQKTPPRLFYTDLISGPSVGGENGEGAFVTLYGTGFGSSREASVVTIGGVPAYAYPVWTEKRVTIQIGKEAKTGMIVMKAAINGETNGQHFTVRPGKIFFVAASSSGRQNGSFLHPWDSLIYARDAMGPGDIVYAMDGVDQSSLEKYDSSFSIQTSGTDNMPLAIVAYPGATVTIGSFTGPQIAARTPNINRTSNHWVLAGLTFHGAQQALDLTDSTDWRVVGNDFSCPNGFGPTGCFEASQATHVAFLGNTVHDIAKIGTTKTYHAVYFSTDTNHVEVGWNNISNVRACRAIQFHSSPLDPGTGFNQFDLHVHDNVIHDVACDGINFATIDASKGPVEAYNNLIYNVGSGPDPGDGSANYACIYVQGGANSGDPGSGVVEIYNNTLYNCGGRRNSDAGAFTFSAGSPSQKVRLSNNIVLLTPGEHLLSPGSSPVSLLGRANIVWPASAIVSADLATHAAFTIHNPLFRDVRTGDFTLMKASPAIGAGVASPLSWDLIGAPRVPSQKPDLGALQHQPDAAL